ncbi:MAG: hypothetical protein D3907_03115, partial [Candidatus Electrothrix sp. AUS3]|nr:hypothetical protein [Candidatus Electrothrix gigas]
MKTKILVANRGEIAIRIIRAIQELNYESTLLYPLFYISSVITHNPNT